MKNLKAIVIGLGSAGDVHPNIGLAMTLRSRGAEVLFVATEVFRPLAERAGVNFIGIGSEDEYHAAISDPDLWHPVRSFPFVAQRLLLPALRPIYEIIEENFEPGRTVVAAPGLRFLGQESRRKDWECHSLLCTYSRSCCAARFSPVASVFPTF